MFDGWPSAGPGGSTGATASAPRFASALRGRRAAQQSMQRLWAMRNSQGPKPRASSKVSSLR
jgi:hypothetical protein